MRRRFALIHNIPSPYRLHLFEVLDRNLAKRGFEFHVHFMARGHSDRGHWRMFDDKLPFRASFWPDWGKQIGDKEWHLNPEMLLELVTNPPDYVMIGGPWDSITGAACSLLPSRSTKLAWYEGNTSTPGRMSGVVGAVKRGLLRRFDQIVVPGQEGIALTELILGKEGPPISVLPNLVDERRFEPSRSRPEKLALREKLGLATSKKLALWVARLVPEKGIAQFVKNLDREILREWTVLLVGEGPLASEVENAISDSGLNGHFIIMPSMPYNEMPSYYRAADLFILPSMVDRNPLSVVEAMHSGLPLLISTRIGNRPEALAEGENGWDLDPMDGGAVRRKATLAFGTDVRHLEEMGRSSLARAQTYWSSDQTVGAFIDSLVAR